MIGDKGVSLRGNPYIGIDLESVQTNTTVYSIHDSCWLSPQTFRERLNKVVGVGAGAVNPMKSTASAGDVQDNTANSRTMDVQHDDDESPVTTESEEGWHTVYYGRRRKPRHELVRDADGVHGANNKVEPGFRNT
ncbi:hypothetical protein MRX96_026077 [Rhipicephalus microplus]